MDADQLAEIELALRARDYATACAAAMTSSVEQLATHSNIVATSFKKLKNAAINYAVWHTKERVP